MEYCIRLPGSWTIPWTEKDKCIYNRATCRIMEQGSYSPTTWNRKQITSGANMEAAMPLLLCPFHPKTIPTVFRHSSQNNKHTKGKIHTWIQDGLSKLNLDAWSCQLQITSKYCKNYVWIAFLKIQWFGSFQLPSINQQWGRKRKITKK